MPKKPKSLNYSRRRLQPTPAPTPRPYLRGRDYGINIGANALASAVKNKEDNKYYQRSKARFSRANKTAKYVAQKNFNLRLNNSDKIITAPAIKIGTPRTISFEEKVSRITHPPVIFHRKWSFSSESASGRKGMFQIPINDLIASPSGTGLFEDIMTSNSSRMSTNTVTADPTLIFTGSQTSQQSYYIDYQSLKDRFMNSGTNSLTGKISLLCCKRDMELTFTNVNIPMTPINLMMNASNGALIQNTVGNEQTVGQGWAFNSTSPGVDYDANYIMPGSGINSGGATAIVDPQNGIFSSHIKDFTGYYYREVESYKFSLSPGQQFNLTTILNDLPSIKRQGIDMTYLRNISYWLVVEFEGQVVGNSAVNNQISIGTAQLSVIHEEKRIIGIHGKMKAQVVMPTTGLPDIALSLQQTINPDNGQVDIGYDDDL